MAKRRRKDKELAHLRREVEVLRAQLAGQQGRKETKATEVTEGEPKPATTLLRQGSEGQAETQKRTETRRVPKMQSTIQSVDPKYIKADLLKSVILTLIALGTIVALTIIL